MKKHQKNPYSKVNAWYKYVTIQIMLIIKLDTHLNPIGFREHWDLFLFWVAFTH